MIDRFANTTVTGNKCEREKEKRKEKVQIDRVRLVNVGDVERLCAAFYEFPSAELAFLSDAKEEWDKAKPYSPQVLFKFSSPLSTSCAPSLSALLGAVDSGRKKVARRSAESRDHTILFCHERNHLSRVFEAFLGERH